MLIKHPRKSGGESFSRLHDLGSAFQKAHVSLSSSWSTLSDLVTDHDCSNAVELSRLQAHCEQDIPRILEQNLAGPMPPCISHQETRPCSDCASFVSRLVAILIVRWFGHIDPGNSNGQRVLASELDRSGAQIADTRMPNAQHLAIPSSGGQELDVQTQQAPETQTSRIPITLRGNTASRPSALRRPQLSETQMRSTLPYQGEEKAQSINAMSDQRLVLGPRPENSGLDVWLSQAPVAQAESRDDAAGLGAFWQEARPGDDSMSPSALLHSSIDTWAHSQISAPPPTLHPAAEQPICSSIDGGPCGTCEDCKALIDRYLQDL